jgi:hypothetical protein
MNKATPKPVSKVPTAGSGTGVAATAIISGFTPPFTQLVPWLMVNT